jgi:hypothetical protein
MAVGVGAGVGDGVGDGVGLAVGDGVGEDVGTGVGLAVGDGVGDGVGAGVGLAVGDGVGAGVGRVILSHRPSLSPDAFVGSVVQTSQPPLSLLSTATQEGVATHLALHATRASARFFGPVSSRVKSLSKPFEPPGRRQNPVVGIWVQVTQSLAATLQFAIAPGGNGHSNVLVVPRLHPDQETPGSCRWYGKSGSRPPENALPYSSTNRTFGHAPLMLMLAGKTPER